MELKEIKFISNLIPLLSYFQVENISLNQSWLRCVAPKKV